MTLLKQINTGKTMAEKSHLPSTALGNVAKEILRPHTSFPPLNTRQMGQHRQRAVI